jgi:Flp pilus assembly protein TadG
MSVARGRRRLIRSERGQSLVELAVTLPILVLLLLGTLDFGMAIFSYSMLRDAAQEGAFYGSFNPASKTEIENRTRNISPRGENEVFSSPINLRDKDLVKVNVKALGRACQGTTRDVTNSIRVSVSYNYPVLMPFVGPLLGSEIPLTGTATNIILQPACP